MHYKLTKKPFLPILLIGFLVAFTLSFYILSRNHAPLILATPYVAAGCVVTVLYTVGRYLAFGLVYTLGEDYTDTAFKIFRLRDTTSSVILAIDLCGDEEIVFLDKSGKKYLKGYKRSGVYTQNMLTPDRYALTTEEDGTRGYLVLELTPAAKEKLAEKIAHAKRINTFDQD